MNTTTDTAAFIPVKKWNAIPVFINPKNNKFCIVKDGQVLADSSSYGALIRKIKLNKLDKVQTMHLKDRAVVIRNSFKTAENKDEWVCGKLTGAMKDSWGRPVFEISFMDKVKFIPETEIVFGDPEMARDLSALHLIVQESQTKLNAKLREAKNLTKLIDHELA